MGATWFLKDGIYVGYFYRIENRDGKVVLECLDRQTALRSLGEDGEFGDKIYEYHTKQLGHKVLIAEKREAVPA